ERRRAEQALHLMKSAIESSISGICIAELNGKLTYVNRAGLRLWGYDQEEEVLGKRATGFWLTEKESEEAVGIAAKTGAWIGELIAVRKDGSPFDVQAIITLMRSSDGTPLAIMGSFLDITERKRAEQALRESEERYRRLVETANEGIWSLDEHLRSTFVNRKMAEMLGYEPEEMLGKTVHSFMFEEDLAEHHEWRRRREQGESDTYERRFKCKDGSEKWTLVSATPVLDQEGNLRGSFAMVTDVTERRKAAAAIRQQRDFLQQLIDTIPTPLFYKDVDGRYLGCNTAFESDTGLSKADIIGKTVFDVAAPELAQIYYEQDLSLFQNPGVQQDETRRRDAAGTMHEVMFTKAPFWDLEGNVAGMVGVIFDVTELKHAQASLQNQISLMESMLEAIPAPVFFKNTDHVYLGCNEAFAKFMGLPKETFIGKSVFDVAPKELAAVYRVQDEALFESAGSQVYESSVETGNGAIHDVIFHKATFADSSGTVAGLIGVILDITERKRAEDALKESEQRYRLLADNTLDVIWQIDLDLRITYVNPAITRLTGHTVDEWIGTSLSEHCDRENFEKMTQAVSAEISKGPASSGTVLEAEFLKKNKEPISVEIHGKAIFSHDGLPIRVQGVTRDITDRRRAESALKASEEKYRNLFENSPVGIMSVDNEGRILEVNRPLLEILGSPSQEATKAINMFKLPQLVQTGVSDLFQSCIASGERLQRQIPYESKWGKKSHLRFVLNPMTDQHGTVCGCQAVVEDFTEQKKLEEQLREAQKMEAIGTLAGGVAHDFNNLLQVVLGYSEVLLAEKQESDEEYADLEKIFHAAKSGGELVHRLLAFSRKSKLKPVFMNLNSQIVEVEKLLRRIIPRMVDVHLDLSGDLPVIHADPSQVEQVLINLALNSCDAMPDGGKLTMRTSAVTVDEEYSRLHFEVAPGAYVLMEISDTGHGMDKETVEHIFEPFFTTKDMGRGSGLGLAMVHGIVKQLNGHITVYSEVGKGTVFRVYLPAIADEGEMDLEASGVLPAFGTETVLLVDDEEFLRELGARILTNHGYKVLRAENGREAIDIYKKEGAGIALVILDLIMPGMGGRECLNGLLKLDPNVKVLVASGYSADESIQEIIQMGAKGFVSKPFRAKEFLRDAYRVLNKG
ncbi:MAG: PAS domain S-box protein, partial [Deltaproteobacteria bacterium]